MIDRITEEVKSLGKSLNEKALKSLKENEESMVKAIESYDMSIKVDEEGALVIQFSRDGSAVTTYTFYKAVS